jgi:hypothetical protein
MTVSAIPLTRFLALLETTLSHKGRGEGEQHAPP